MRPATTASRGERAQQFLLARRRAPGAGSAPCVSGLRGCRSTTCGASGACPATSIRSIRSSMIRRSARGWRVFAQGLERVVGLCAADRARCRAARPGRAVPGSCARALLPDSGRFAAGLPAAARFAALGQARGLSVHARSRIRCRTSRRCALRGAAMQRCRARAAAARDAPPAPQESASLDHAHRDVRASRATACCTSSCRRLERAEDYLELVAAVEAHGRGARAAGHAGRLRAAASDPRLNHFRITPDPGVIEVNIQPSHDLERAGRAHRRSCTRPRAPRAWAPRNSCSTAATPAPAAAITSCSAAPRAPDSPFLRRPDLLGSLLIATGTTIRRCRTCSRGCSSARPRRRRASTRRATIRCTSWRLAFQQLPAPGSEGAAVAHRPAVAQSADRCHRQYASRRVLHRQAVFARWPHRRLGLLELRAFEMPPHARMSLTQQLLLRSLVARFWQTPYRPARLGALGHRTARPLHAAVLRRAGFSRCARRAAGGRLCAASRPGSRRTSNSAFPSTAISRCMGIELELRQALEPWHVMGEEGAAGRRGALRRLLGGAPAGQGRPAWRRIATPSTCNGRRVPLRPTGTVGEFVAGVRYRAWQPPSALHPRIGVHAPLTFDLVDTWMQRSLGGCQYHVDASGRPQLQHLPGQRVRGREPAAGALLPHGAYARERAAAGDGGLSAGDRASSPEFPFTLDLRRFRLMSASTPAVCMPAAHSATTSCSIATARSARTGSR